MKKILSLIVLLFCFLFITTESFSAVNKQINANIKTKRVPEGTIIPMKLLDPVGSDISTIGQQFDLMVTENIKVDNIVVIPQGSVVRGSVEAVQPSKILYKGGVVRLYFDHIVNSIGKHVPFYAVIYDNPNVTYSGSLSSNTTYSDAFHKTTKTTKNIVIKSANWGWDKGEELFNGSPKYVLAPVTTCLSIPVAGVYFAADTVLDIFKKGKNISLNQGEILQVKLLRPLDMPVY